MIADGTVPGAPAHGRNCGVAGTERCAAQTRVGVSRIICFVRVIAVHPVRRRKQAAEKRCTNP